MLTYTFSKREKALLIVLAVVLIGIAWYEFILVPAQDQSTQLDGQIAEAQDEMSVDAVKAQQIQPMRDQIAKYQAEGIEPSVVPAYDNTQALMAELDDKLQNAFVFLMQFDDVDMGDGSAGTLAKRGLDLGFQCASYDSARDILLSLAHGDYSCSIDEYEITDGPDTISIPTSAIVGSNRTSDLNCQVTAHLTFYETIGSAAGSAGGSASGDGASADGGSATQLGDSFGMVNAGRGAGQNAIVDGGSAS